MTDEITSLADLLLETGQAHHAAFYDVDGDDPDWPLWYATFLEQRLPNLLGRTLTRSQLTWTMIELDRRYRLEKPADEWQEAYARFLRAGVVNENTGVSPILRVENVPAITTKQMIAVDRLMIEQYQIDLLQMMENAGRCLANLAARRFLNADPRGKNVLLLAGPGGNGGGALVAARYLANYGARVNVAMTHMAGDLTETTRRQLTSLQQMHVAVEQNVSQAIAGFDFDLLIDGIIGYSLRGAPHGNASGLIRWANSQPTPLLALDVPSGLNGSTGKIYDPCIKAAATLTLALPKTGLLHDGSASFVGELYLADIGVPPQLYLSHGLELDVGPIFALGDIVRLD